LIHVYCSGCGKNPQYIKSPGEFAAPEARTQRSEVSVTQQRIHQRDDRGEGIVELNGGALLVPSFTDSEQFYKVHPDSGYCSCPAFSYKGVCRKHVCLAEAVQKARELRFGSESAERNALELCKQIFGPYKHTTCADSYDLLLEVLAYRHSTEAMIREAHRRHGRILALHGKAA
jgi:hypothetical protein